MWASTWLCQVYRYWIATEKAGTCELLIDNLPGYCDNINRASDGKYWLAFVGLRSPVYDLAMANPGFRIRMVKQIPPDEWLCPGINYGSVDQVRRRRRGERVAVGSGRQVASDDHIRSRTQRLSLYRRTREQSHRAHPASERRPDLGSACDSYWGAADLMSLVGDIIDRVLFPKP